MARARLPSHLQPGRDVEGLRGVHARCLRCGQLRRVRGAAQSAPVLQRADRILGVRPGDHWLANNLPAILNSPEYKNGSTAVFVTWDEGAGGTARNCATNTVDVGCHVVAIVISPSTRVGTRSGKLFNHYSLLGTADLRRASRRNSSPL
jgi:hypothetical protein